MSYYLYTIQHIALVEHPQLRLMTARSTLTLTSGSTGIKRCRKHLDFGFGRHRRECKLDTKASCQYFSVRALKN